MSSQDSNPLQLGQVLYEILDATVIATPKGASAPQYNRVSFTTQGGSIVDQSNLDATDALLDARACTDPVTATTPVFTLSAAAVSMIGTASGSWPVPAAGCTNIVGIDPLQTQQRTLLLLGANATGPFLLPVVCMDGQTTPSVLQLTGVAGTPAGGLLARQQLSARVAAASISGSHLLLYDLGSCALGPAPSAPVAYPSVDLGAVGTGPVAMTACSIVPGVDQQIAVAFVDASAQLNVHILGWDTQGTLAEVASWTGSSSAAPTAGPALSELAMENTTVRIAAGDLIAAGQDQLVVGFAATFQGTAGCAALLLFELIDNTLTFSSSTAMATADSPPQPIASIDLHLGAGIFGDPLPGDAAGGDGQGVLGLLVAGCGASASQLFAGEASIRAGIVPVSPIAHAFPSVKNAPATPELLTTIMTVSGDTSSFLALASDVTGQSVILGPPTLSQTEGQRGQLLAIVQVPPYETSVASSEPSLTLSHMTTEVDGCNVSSNKMWMFSKDSGTTIGIGPLTFGQTLVSSYGNGFTNVTDNSTSTQLQSSTTISGNDLIVLYAMAYDVWVYPVYRKSVQDAPDGTVAVIFPQTPAPLQTIIPASDASIGFKPASQIGTLLTYVDAPMDGYDSDSSNDNLIFELVSFPVLDTTDTTNVTYDQTKMNTRNIGVDYTVHNSTTDSTHFAFSTTLFDYVPVNFGLNLSDGSSYTDNEVTTTSVSYTTSLTISIASGSVKDIVYSFQVTPYIYQHDTMGCLMVAYGVSLDGLGWTDYYSSHVMPVMLVALLQNTEDVLLAAFSRDISFAAQPDDSVDVTVSMFNNSLTAVQNVTCELYIGRPVVQSSTLQPPSATPAVQTLANLGASARGSVTFNTTLANPSDVTVRIYSSGLEMSAVIYWAVYPPEAFANYDLT